MEHKNETFHYTYDASQRAEVERIREKYIPKEADKLEQLRMLDRSAYTAARVVSVVMGVAGSLTMGTGMSLCMSPLGAALGTTAMPVGIGIGLAGMSMAAFAYPMYSLVLKTRRRRLAPRILKLTDELMQ